jgi:hypothetical protein
VDAVTEKFGERRDVAAYVEALAGELVTIALRHDLDTLAYILDMARLEAHSAQRRNGH